MAFFLTLLFWTALFTVPPYLIFMKAYRAAPVLAVGSLIAMVSCIEWKDRRTNPGPVGSIAVAAHFPNGPQTLPWEITGSVWPVSPLRLTNTGSNPVNMAKLFVGCRVSAYSDDLNHPGTFAEVTVFQPKAGVVTDGSWKLGPFQNLRTVNIPAGGRAFVLPDANYLPRAEGRSTYVLNECVVGGEIAPIWQHFGMSRDKIGTYRYCGLGSGTKACPMSDVRPSAAFSRG